MGMADGIITITDPANNNYAMDHEMVHALADKLKLLDGFIQATGCQQDPANPNGPYLYTEMPYWDYGRTNCDEGIAVECGDEYPDPSRSCTMKTARPNTYNFCKSQVFNNVEFCNSGTQGSILNKFMKLVLNLFNPVHAAGTSVLVTADATEEKLDALTPGTTNVTDIRSSVGTPLQTLQQTDKTIYTFKSSDASRPHLVYVQNGVVTFVQIVLGKTENISTEMITAKYGSPEEKSFSTHSTNSPVYSYPSLGLSFIIDGSTNKVQMIQKFVPTTTSGFNSTVGKDFTSQQYGDPVQQVTTIKEQLAAKPGNKQVGLTNKLPLVLIISGISAIFLISIIGVVVIRKIKKHKQDQNIVKPPPVISV
jgi:hypothetical protein